LLSSAGATRRENGVRQDHGIVADADDHRNQLPKRPEQ